LLHDPELVRAEFLACLITPIIDPRLCAQAAERARDPAGRVALLQVSQCFILLAKYVANQQEHVAAHWDTEEHIR
jgi:hypothetical protein